MKIFSGGGEPSKLIHKFRSPIRDLAVVNNRLVVTTDVGVYRKDRNSLRFRLVKEAVK